MEFPGSADQLVADNRRFGLTIDASTSQNGHGDPLDLELALAALERASRDRDGTAASSITV